MTDEAERVKAWKQANPDKVRGQKRRYYARRRNRREVISELASTLASLSEEAFADAR